MPASVSFKSSPSDAFIGALIAPEADGEFKLVSCGDGDGGYSLPKGGHDHFADFFHLLANRIATREPKNRRVVVDRPSDLRIKPLLTEGHASEAPYGFGDPWVLRFEGSEVARYYLVVTSNDAPNSFPIFSSTDLRTWKHESFVFPKGSKPAWATDGPNVSDYWAPELHRIGGRFVLCFSARKSDRSMAIGLATAHHPTGPFVTAEAPLLPEGVIDPHIFVDVSGEAFLFWKEDNNDVWPALLCHLLHDESRLGDQLFDDPEDRRTARLYATLWPWIETLEAMERFFALQVLIEAVSGRYNEVKSRLRRWAGAGGDADGRVEPIVRTMRTPVYGQRLLTDTLALDGDKFPIIENDLEWEGPLIEGMCLTRADDRYYLFYSGNDFSTADYGIGYAVAKDIKGPYAKAEEPLIKSSRQWWGPGHPSVALGIAGQPLLFMHAYPAGAAGYKQFRAMLVAKLSFSGDTVDII
jgi:hypothetical protein